MNAISCLRLLSIVAIFLTAGTLTLAAGPQAQPNIVLIMVDDMGWSDLGCYGSEIETPNIDSLAAEGLLFTQFYNNAKCTTTRASLLTGLYPRNGGRGQHELITTNMLTLGEAMRHAGYSTGMSGKWHNGKKVGTRPFDRGFDESYGLWDGCCNFFNPKIRDPEFKGGGIRTFGHNDVFLEFSDFPENYYTTDAFTDHAIKTIKSHAASGKPFFHYLPYTAPHYPLHAKPADIASTRGNMRRAGMFCDNNAWRSNCSLASLIKTGLSPDRDDLAKDWQQAKTIDEDWQQHRMEVYAAMIDSVDQNIGRLLDALDELGVGPTIRWFCFWRTTEVAPKLQAETIRNRFPDRRNTTATSVRVGPRPRILPGVATSSIVMKVEFRPRCWRVGPPSLNRAHARIRSATSSTSCPPF